MNQNKIKIKPMGIVKTMQCRFFFNLLSGSRPGVLTLKNNVGTHKWLKQKSIQYAQNQNGIVYEPNECWVPSGLRLAKGTLCLKLTKDN